MNRRTRTALVVLVAVALALALAPVAFAAAGGGSAGFGGGGSGGGGGGGGGGKGFALYILIRILIQIAILGHGLGAAVLIGLVLLWFVFARVVPRAQRSKSEKGPAARRQVAKRERRVELAAAEAAEDDPAFAPDNVRSQAASLFSQIQAAWDQGDRSRLSRLVAPDLLREWDRRLSDLQRRGWRNRVELLAPPQVEYVSLQHRGEGGDRVTCRIEAKLRDYVEDALGNRIKRANRLNETVSIREFWTLIKRGDRWILESIEQGGEGAHVLTDQLVATPWSDEQALRDEALVEQAAADALPAGMRPADVADLNFDGPARAAALDLSVADGRFSPDLLEIAARRAVGAWAEAVDGDDQKLYAIAHGPAARELLHPGDPTGRTRIVVRAPKIKQIRINGLDAAAEPPTMSIEVDISGRRYIEDRDTTALIAGNKARETTFTERWTMALDGDASQPWRIASVASPLARA